jgi:hypothetical protein
LQEAQGAFNRTLETIVPTGEVVTDTLDGIADTLENLAAPSETVGAAIAGINQNLREGLAEAQNTKAELDALRGGAGFDVGPGLELAGPGGREAAEERAKNDAVAEAAAEGQRKLDEIGKNGREGRFKADSEFRQKQLSATGSFFQSLTQIAGNKSKGLFKISKAVNIATGTANAFASFNEALKNPPGPPFTVPIAAAALASGLAQVASIKSQQIPSFQGGGIMRRAGLAEVGESGRELVELPAGARVRPAGVTERLSGGGLSIGQFIFQAPAGGGSEIDAERVANDVLERLADRLERRENPRFISAVERSLNLA